ncbi:androgen-dependent TFPI-regulating protein-like isoform X1 [Harmonia axyridis]|uniref:androgen-dependent TFPI-regulating protein-like isoform X1 n=2 Tax=Harmonia axyridis TaxID=115357 RepID=UPI001E275DF9|nr:androgen-dependent TFPI-regulating protein-like isoform X1 [Harmonia axyridis]
MFRLLSARKKLVIKMMLKDRKLCFHSFTVLIFITALIWQLDYTKDSIPENRYMADVQEYPLRYFSNWNVVMQFIYFSIVFSLDIEDYIPWKIWSSVWRASLMRMKDYVFSTLLFPFASFVTVFFWTFYLYDRELVFPVSGEYFFTKYANHVAHTAVGIFAVLELFFTGDQLRVSFKSCFNLISTVTAIYYTLFFYHYIEKGRFLYTMYNFYTWYQTAGLLTLSYLWTILNSFIGLRLQKHIRGAKPSTAKD